MRAFSSCLFALSLLILAGCNTGKSSSAAMPAVGDVQISASATPVAAASAEDQTISALMNVRQGFSSSPSAFVQSFEAVLPVVGADGKVSVNGASSSSLDNAEKQIIQMIESDAAELKMLPTSTISELQQVCAAGLSQLQGLDVSSLSADLQDLVAADIAILQELQKQL